MPDVEQAGGAEAEERSAAAFEGPTAWDLGAVRTSPGRVRAWAGVLLLGSVALLAVAAYVVPASDRAGNRLGSHRQIPGLGPCGMMVQTGFPCPTCGMTTAFSHTVRGQLGQAFLAQPTGLILALVTVGLVPLAAWCLWAGRLPAVQIPVLTPYRLCLAMLILLVGGWAFKLFYGLATGSLPYRPGSSGF